MKILYAIQGTGNGHISRAQVLVPLLKAKADVDILISGRHHELTLPFDVKYAFRGCGFYFGKNGGIDYAKTLQKLNLLKFMKEMEEIHVSQYDVVLSDFEPISAWAARKYNITCIGISHQASFMYNEVPRIKKRSFFGEMIFRHYAPAGIHIGFHFQRYNPNVFLPIFRDNIHNARTCNQGHYTVYLPAYSDEKILEALSQVPEVRWEVFSKHIKRHTIKSSTTSHITIRPVDEFEFTRSMIGAEGVLCGAGFETPAEAIQLGKKLLVIPISKQYEQQCNAEALARLGVPVLKKLSKKNIDLIRKWVVNEQKYLGSFANQNELVINHLMKMIKLLVSTSENYVSEHELI